MSNYYIKGDVKTILKRINQIHTITLYCPMQDPVVQELKKNFDNILPAYKVDDNKWANVYTTDASDVFLITSSYNTSGDLGILLMISSAFKSFKNLKKVNFEFTDDQEIYESYVKSLEKGKITMKKHVYKIECVELNLSNMFSQEIIDIFNKVLIMDEIIPNDLFERKYLINFTFDEYCSFIGSFLGNNDNFNNMDHNIKNYFFAFPTLINDHKPEIRVITNYSEI